MSQNSRPGIMEENREELLQKLGKLSDKVDRLQKERNKLLHSNRKMVKLFSHMERFIQHEIQVGRISKSELAAGVSLDASTRLDIQEIEKQISSIETEIEKIQKD